MRPITYTPEEQEAMLAPMPGLLRKPVTAIPPCEAAPVRKCRAVSPEARRASNDKARVYSARMRLRESLGMLRAATERADAAAIAKARQWVTTRTAGLHRVLRELGLEPTPEDSPSD